MHHIAGAAINGLWLLVTGAARLVYRAKSAEPLSGFPGRAAQTNVAAALILAGCAAGGTDPNLYVCTSTVQPSASGRYALLAEFGTVSRPTSDLAALLATNEPISMREMWIGPGGHTDRSAAAGRTEPLHLR